MKLIVSVFLTKIYKVIDIAILIIFTLTYLSSQLFHLISLNHKHKLSTFAKMVIFKRLLLIIKDLKYKCRY